MTDKELIEKAIGWFNTIADDADRLTTGNLSHNKATLKGRAIRAAKFLEKHKNEESPVSKDLKEAAYRFAIGCEPLRHEYGGYTSPNPEIEDAVIYGAQWEEKQMMKDAVEGHVATTFNDRVRASTILMDKHIQKTLGIKFGDTVKIIIIKEADYGKIIL